MCVISIYIRRMPSLTSNLCFISFISDVFSSNFYTDDVGSGI